ncbi:hypothetical protein ILYODFUR_035420 [Ilyodon furcidens]|uniref:Uncharacterized protein n=1 Tax=Ilyodon furcidens TaxID=33524 RepID=A0ABV0TTQ0_9TELE
MSPEHLVLQPKVTEIHIDIPRTNPLIPLFQQASVQEVRPLQEHTHHLTLGGFSLLLLGRLAKAVNGGLQVYLKSHELA